MEACKLEGKKEHTSKGSKGVSHKQTRMTERNRVLWDARMREHPQRLKGKARERQPPTDKVKIA